LSRFLAAPETRRRRVTTAGASNVMGMFVAKASEVENTWRIVDATDLVLGRLATRVAMVLMGKHRPIYTPNVDTGEHVIVINAGKIRIEPSTKPRTRLIRRHTGFLGVGMKEAALHDLYDKNPEKLVQLAVRRMLPKTKLGRHMFAKLRVYRGAEHPHSAQNPQPFPEWI
jgi:large subunit ribosomal protein L13